MNQKSLKRSFLIATPFAVLFLMIAFFYQSLYLQKGKKLPSALIGKSLPAFQLNNLLSPHVFSNADLYGQVSLLNVFATWCEACKAEMPTLLKIKQEFDIPIYGIAYKDKPEAAMKWLEAYGNPFQMIGDDAKGDVAIDLGVYGTPETFLINRKGKIVYRHVGVIDDVVWERTLYPYIKKIRKKT